MATVRRASTGNTVAVYGISEFESNIDQLNKKVAKDIIEGALKAGAVIVRVDAQARAPMGTKSHKFKEKGKIIVAKPGNLKRKLKERKLTGKRATIGQIQFIIPLDNRAFYGKFQEWGWRTKNGKYIMPQRFLQPAYESKKDEALAEVSKLLGDGIEAEARRLGAQNAS